MQKRKQPGHWGKQFEREKRETS